ncbi:MAG: O-antigen ligase family protein, partial [Pseudomonadota bacterium]
MHKLTGATRINWPPSIQAQNVCFVALMTSLVAVVGSFLTVALVVSLIWVLLSIARQRTPFRIEQTTVPFVAVFSIFALIGFAMARVHLGSFFGSAGSEYLLFLAPLVLMPRFAVGPDKENIRTIFKYGMVAAGILAGIIAAIQVPYWVSRAEGGAGNALAFATVATLAGVGSFFLLLEPEQPRDRLIGIFGWTGAVIAVVLSQSRTLIVVLLLCTLILAMLNWRQISSGLSRVAAILLVALALVISVMAATVVIERISADVTPVANETSAPSSAGWRRIYLQMGWQVASDNLLVGVGRDERAYLIGRESEAHGYPTKIQVEVTYSSWHKYLPGFLQPTIVNWQLERLNRALDNQHNELLTTKWAVEATTTERISSQHSHLHNAYMTMLVDHG